jgi:ligand-binding sensor domain-containing protein/signal transduction histidine kinase
VKAKPIRTILTVLVLAALAAALAGLPALRAAPAVADPGPVTPEARQPALQTGSPLSIPPIIRFHRIGLDEGLSQSVITCILQDDRGFMWFGTQDGLNRYDGSSFEVYRPNPNDPGSISDNWINVLFQDHQGYLWVGTTRGLNRYDPLHGEFTRFLHDPDDPRSLTNDNIQAIYEDSAQILWIGTADGLNRFSSARDGFLQYYTESSLPPGISGNNITALYEDEAGNLWVGTAGNGLNRYVRHFDGFSHYASDPAAPASISSNTITAIVGDRRGLLWVATDRGLEHFDPETGVFVHYRHSSANPASLANDNIQALFVDHAGNLWVGTNDGLDRFDRSRGQFVHYRHEPGNINSLGANTISAIAEDRGSVMWIGTFGGGLSVYDHGQDRFTSYYHQPANPNSLSGNIVFPISVDSQGNAWVGTYGNGLNRFDPVTRQFTHYRHSSDPASLQNDDVWAIHVDRSGLLWVGTSTGLDWLDPATGQASHYQASPGDIPLDSTRIHSIHEDRSGLFWIATDQGLYEFDARRRAVVARYVHRYDEASSLSDNEIYTIFEDSSGIFWLGTFNGGLERFDPLNRTFRHYRHDPENRSSLSDDTVLSIFEDSHNVLWVGTSGGLNRYLPEIDAFAHYTDTDGLPNNFIYGILEDAAGFLWLSTNFGLARFDPLTETARNYSASDGLQSNEFSLNSYALGISGEMYFGGIDGFTVFDPLAVEDNPYSPPVVLTAFTQDGIPVDRAVEAEALQEVTLYWPRNYFEFEFVALSYAQPENNQHAYLLENFDDGWNYIGTQHDGRYTNLPSGTYVLRLRGANHDGMWNEAGDSIRITVVPPFWQANWFRTGLMVVALGIAFGGYRLRVMGVDRRNRELERQVRERTSALQRRNEEMQALYQADEKMLRSLTLDHVYQALVDIAEDMLHADRSLILVWQASLKVWQVRTARGFPTGAPHATTACAADGLLRRVAGGEAIILQDLQDDPQPGEDPGFVRACLGETVRSAIALPLHTGSALPAVFIVGFRAARLPAEEVQRLFIALVQRAALSIENTRLFEQAKELAVVEERNRLARDLHDSAKQKAFAALAQLGTANGILQSDAGLAKSHMAEAENLVYEVIQELTFLIQELYPVALQEKGLATTLRDYVFEWENRNEILVDLNIRGERRAPLEIEQAIYRVIQEALANVARHSRATRVEIVLNCQDETIDLLVADNGSGFDTGQKPAGMGLRSIRERVEGIHGSLHIESVPGQGTRVHAQVPIQTSLLPGVTR